MVSSKDTRRSTPTRDWVLLVPVVRVLLCSARGCNRLPNIALVRSEYADLVLTVFIRFWQKMQLEPLFFCALTIAHRCSTLHYQCRLLLPAMAPSLTSSSAVFQFYGVQCFLMAPITVIGFHALHMHGLHLWEFLAGDLLCPAYPTTTPSLVIPKRLLTRRRCCLQTMLIRCPLMTLSLVLTWLDWMRMLATGIVEFEFAYQMWAFLHDC
jgi:hypothetical protein